MFEAIDIDIRDGSPIALAMNAFESDLKALLEKHAGQMHDAILADTPDPRLTKELNAAPLHFHALVSMMSSVASSAAVSYLVEKNKDRLSGIKLLTLPSSYADAIGQATVELHERYQNNARDILLKGLKSLTDDAIGKAMQQGKPADQA